MSYLLFSGLYQYYLTQNKANSLLNSPDFITQKVAQQTVFIGKLFNYDIHTEANTDEPSMKLIFNSKYVARVVEGCNSMSVLILFWSFIIAFSGKWNETLIFGVLGSIALYLMNIFRILILTVAIFHLPNQTNFLHKIIFPAIIYGFTFMLWVLWVNRLEKLKNRNQKLE